MIWIRVTIKNSLKGNILISILRENDILGLNNLMIPIDNNNSKGLINCKTLVGKSEVYELDLNKLYSICQVEDRIKI